MGPTIRPSFFLPPRPNVLTGDRLAVQRVELGLVVERVDVARPAVHEQEDDALGLGRQRRGLGRQRVDERRDAVGRDGLPGQEAVAAEQAPSSATEPKPPPISQRNSRRVRPQNEPCGRSVSIRAWFRLGESVHAPIGRRRQSR